MLLSASCSKFLEEEPAGFITPEKYYTTEDQVQAAVNGTYAGLDDVFSTGIGVAISPSFLLEYITGYGYRLRPSDHADNQFLRPRSHRSCKRSSGRLVEGCLLPGGKLQ